MTQKAEEMGEVSEGAKAAFYECADCKKPFFGGTIDCARELALETKTKQKDLKC